MGYNVQIAVEAEHHLIVTHEVTNDGTDRSQLSHVAKETKATLDVDELDVVADRGYFNGEEILASIGVRAHPETGGDGKDQEAFHTVEFSYETPLRCRSTRDRRG